MAERYGVLLPSYWDGPTGKQIQAKGGEAVILGAYLGSNKYANMIGLYELPLLYVLHDLPVQHAHLGIVTLAGRTPSPVAAYAVQFLAQAAQARYPLA